MSKLVNTVLGPVSSDQLGKTLMHEHFCFGFPGYYGNTVHVKERSELVRLGVEVANKAKAQGVKTIVDATPNDCGREPEILKEISEQSGIHIICSTGYYYEGEGAPAYFKFKQTLGVAEQELYELLVGEITNGIGKTGIRPGVIKLGTSKDTITDYEKLMIKVAAKAQQATGVPIITHTQEGTMGPEQAALLVEAGADPKKTVVGHMCGNTDIRYQLDTLKHGVYVGFDRVGLEGLVGTPLDSERIAVLVGLIGRGYANQITLSHDTVNIWLGAEPQWPEEMAAMVENWGIDHIFKNIIPVLKESRVTDGDIDAILVDNPRNIFSA
ncbi:phosphotriesterase family protein [Bacillus dakarensis]|uniref:phosphotriesterase family protein n=1 Tax=Robertmurraya dakarensis TaxID=1926278 RepID=UPI0009815567|nr:phosphotriesterase-related protein [Bacillus dakarensis]